MRDGARRHEVLQDARGSDFIPDATYQGVRSLRGIIWAVKFYGRERPDFRWVLKRLNQDPCEQSFSHMRSAGGSNQHPTIAQAFAMCRHGAVMRLTKKRKTNSGGAPLEIGVEGNLPRRQPSPSEGGSKAQQNEL